jgi:AICAR transformylase/IMP cyclohydrolase PurH
MKAVIVAAIVASAISTTIGFTAGQLSRPDPARAAEVRAASTAGALRAIDRKVTAAYALLRGPGEVGQAVRFTRRDVAAIQDVLKNGSVDRLLHEICRNTASSSTSCFP